MPNVEIVDVTPRDGLQNEAICLSVDARADLVGRLIGAGVRRIEAVSFVSARRVPQMAEAEAVIDAIGDRGGAQLSGLALSITGVERAIAAKLDEVCFVTVASDAFSQRNQGVTTETAIAAWAEMASSATEAGLYRTVTIAAAFGCPFTGEVEPARIEDIAAAVADAGAEEIALADTIGVGVPTQVRDLVTRVRRAAPKARLRVHFHNTRNTGYANAAAALEAGVTTLDASVGGLGGCPFAPSATGNIATEDLVYLAERMGYASGLDPQALVTTGGWLKGQLDHGLPGLLAKAGWFPGVYSGGTKREAG